MSKSKLFYIGLTLLGLMSGSHLTYATELNTAGAPLKPVFDIGVVTAAAPELPRAAQRKVDPVKQMPLPATNRVSPAPVFMTMAAAATAGVNPLHKPETPPLIKVARSPEKVTARKNLWLFGAGLAAAVILAGGLFLRKK